MMTNNRPIARLFAEWLAAARQEVACYLSANGDGPVNPAVVAAKCPSCLNRPAVAAWILNGKET